MYTKRIAQAACRMVIVAGLTATHACTANRNTPSDTRPPTSGQVTRDTKGAPHRITPTEIREVSGFTALDAVRRLRPHFLIPYEPRPGWSSATKSIYENGKYLGGIEYLGDIPLRQVVEIEHFSPTQARAVFGEGCYCDGGVVSVKTTAYHP